MTGRARSRRLALLVRDRPYRRRAARSDIDTALAAAAMELDIEVYFLGAAVMQLVARRDPEQALLPPGYPGWGALGEFAEVRVFAERGWLRRCEQDGLDLSLPVQSLGPAEMAERWRGCDHALLLGTS